MSFANTQYEYSCIHAMIKFYKWLFQVAEDENRKDEVRHNLCPDMDLFDLHPVSYRPLKKPS
jgi:hypothetical protein